MNQPRQTLSFLSRRFKEVGIRPRTALGQNFLVDLNLLDVLLRAAELGPEDVVLEVGTGTGSLTALMAAAAAHVVSVEVDSQLHQLASEELFHQANVTLLKSDALRGKNRVNPEVLAAVQPHLAAEPRRRWKLAANLPYHIATPLMSNLLALDRPPEAMIVTIQKELADRIMAPPGVKDYSALSVWIQAQCQVELVRVLPPTVFWPRPKVSSAIIKVVLDPARRARLADRAFFHEFVRSMFFHRRKFLRSELLTACKDRLDKPQVDALLAALNYGPEARAEQLSVEQFIALSDAVQANVAQVAQPQSPAGA